MQRKKTPHPKRDPNQKKSEPIPTESLSEEKSTDIVLDDSYTEQPISNTEKD